VWLKIFKSNCFSVAYMVVLLIASLLLVLAFMLSSRLRFGLAYLLARIARAFRNGRRSGAVARVPRY
jgi:hypothetical protein